MGQFIRCVDPDSPAEYAGLRPKDRLVEVISTDYLRLDYCGLAGLHKISCQTSICVSVCRWKSVFVCVFVWLDTKLKTDVICAWWNPVPYLKI